MNSTYVCQVRGSRANWGAGSSADSSFQTHICQFSPTCALAAVDDRFILLLYTDRVQTPRMCVSADSSCQTPICQYSPTCSWNPVYSLVLDILLQYCQPPRYICQFYVIHVWFRLFVSASYAPIFPNRTLQSTSGLLFCFLQTVSRHPECVLAKTLLVRHMQHVPISPHCAGQPVYSFVLYRIFSWTSYIHLPITSYNFPQSCSSGKASLGFSLATFRPFLSVSFKTCMCQLYY